MMMMQTMRTKINWLSVRFWVLLILVIVYFVWQYKLQQNYKENYKNVACPSLFSGDDSFRDTLITIKNVDVCNEYLMENLK